MTASDMTKKRPRSEDCEECLPISKRINRLQIESEIQSMKTAEDMTDRSNGCIHNDDISAQCRNLRINSDPSCRHVDGANELSNACSTSCAHCSRLSVEEPHVNMRGVLEELKEGYKPDLKEEENPHYYQINHLLFHAHVQRTERTLIKFPD